MCMCTGYIRPLEVFTSIFKGLLNDLSKSPDMATVWFVVRTELLIDWTDLFNLNRMQFPEGMA